MEKATKSKFDWRIVAHDALAIAWVAFSTIISQFIVCYPAKWIFGKESCSTPLGTSIITAVIYIMTMLLVIFVPALIDKKYKSTRESLGLTELPTFTDIGISILGYIATLIISGYVVYTLQNFNLLDATQPQNVGYNNLMNGLDRTVAFIALVVITPFFEELIFRGWLYRRLKNKSGIIVAAILTAILFGALHGQWNVGIVVGIMSVIMCIEQELTGTIYAGILTHMIKNGVAFWLLYIVAGI